MIEWLKQFAGRQKRVLQALVSLGFFVVLFWRYDVYEFVDHLHNVPLVYLISWIVFYFVVSGIVWGARIYMLFRRIGGGNYWRIVAVGYKLQVLGTVIPGQLGDMGLVYFLKDIYKPKQSAAVLFVDKTISMYITFLIAAIGLGVIFSWYYAFILLLLITGAGLVFVLAWKLRRALLRKGTRWIRLSILERFAGHLDDLHDEIGAIVADFSGISMNVFLTLFQAAFAGISLILILSWFGMSAELWYVILVQGITQLVVLIPVTLMGLGLLETIHIQLLARVGLPPEAVLAAMLSGRAIHLMIIVAVFIVWTGQGHAHRASAFLKKPHRLKENDGNNIERVRGEI